MTLVSKSICTVSLLAFTLFTSGCVAALAGGLGYMVAKDYDINISKKGESQSKHAHPSP